MNTLCQSDTHLQRTKERLPEVFSVEALHPIVGELNIQPPSSLFDIPSEGRERDAHFVSGATGKLI